MDTSLVRFKTLPQTEILSGWKEIAVCLKRGTRTVQRYEHTAGLPVRRTTDSPHASVFALRSELQDWLDSRSKAARARQLSQDVNALTIKRLVDERGRLEEQLKTTLEVLRRLLAESRDYRRRNIWGDRSGPDFEQQASTTRIN